MNSEDQEDTVMPEIKVIYFGICLCVINSTKVMVHSFVTLINICAESTKWQTLSSHERYNINETTMISPLHGAHFL